jgi:transaldolase
MAFQMKRLAELGQSVWYDFIRRDLCRGPELKRLVEEEGLRGMTSNPTIFRNAIADSSLYDDDIERARRAGLTPAETFDELTIADVCAAADVFRPLFDDTGGDSGYVSLEVQPHLAGDTEATVAEARRLWRACSRPNVMIKIPATAAGIPAIRRCLAAGININITLLFSVPRYREVMEAYLGALEERVDAGEPIEGLASVASFFVSRVDTSVDRRLDALTARGDDRAAPLRSKVGIANAQLAYEAFEEVFRGERFADLRIRAARVQKPLWASTSSKDPTYPLLYYVEALVAPNTVDTMTPATFAAYRAHGHPRVAIRDNLGEARAVFSGLASLGLDFETISQELEEDGVKKFCQSYDSALEALASKGKRLGGATAEAAASAP